MAAPMRDNSDFFCPCEDFMQFEDALKRLRVDDDKIIYRLNAIIPTQSFAHKVDATGQCKDLHEKMTRLSDGREKAIRHCVTQTIEEVEKWREQKMKDRNDMNALAMLRNSETKLRQMQRELDIEKIVRAKSMKVFYERCRNVYTPPHRPPV